VDPEYLLDGDTTIRQNIPRVMVASNLSALTTQVMLSVAVPLQKFDKVTSISFRSATTATNTPTNYWFALYSTAATPALIAQTADQTSAAWGANTVKTLSLPSVFEVPESGVYYAAVMVKATTPPTLAGVSVQHADVSTALITGQKVLAQTSGAALTDTAPATIATPTAVTTVPWVAIQ
jgi:hypothetical protein